MGPFYLASMKKSTEGKIWEALPRTAQHLRWTKHLSIRLYVSSQNTHYRKWPFSLQFCWEWVCPTSEAVGPGHYRYTNAQFNGQTPAGGGRTVQEGQTHSLKSDSLLRMCVQCLAHRNSPPLSFPNRHWIYLEVSDRLGHYLSECWLYFNVCVTVNLCGV